MAIKVRDYEVRMTKNSEERKQFRQLRYDVFVEEEGASATDEQKQLREEYDSYDSFADYMGVFHNDKLVGGYRIIDRDAAEKMNGFYTETEFNISKIKKSLGNIAEMSRASVAKGYRENGLVMRMLWLGLGEYVAKNRVKIIFGVLSFVGQKSVESAHAISYLFYNHLTPLNLRATVLSENFADGINPKLSRMNILPRAFVDEDLAHKQMTPLLKGYVRIGASFGKGVFIDKPFNSYDVFVVLQTKNIAASYQKHFAGSETAFEDLGLKNSAIKKLGKLMLMPVAGPFKILRAIAQFFMRDYAGDIELVEDPKAPKDKKESKSE